MHTRREFIRTLGFSAAGMSLSFLPSDLVATSRHQKPSDVIRVKGKVATGTRGLPNVVVSDGLSVTRTDNAGNFILVSDVSRDFIHVSIPSGYDIPKLNNGSASFFRKIDKSTRENSVVFNLLPCSVPDKKHHILVLADTQIQDEYEAQQLITVTVPDVRQTVEKLGDSNIVGIGCGDLVYDNFDLFKDYNEAVTRIGAPFFQVVGNHDLDLEAGADSLSVRTFKSHFGPNYYSFNRGEIHYIILDSVFYTGNKKYIGYISDAQLVWLEQDLQFVERGSTVVVAMHIPLVTGNVHRNPGIDHDAGTVSNRELVYRILEPFKAHILSGHTHFNDNTFHGKIFEHNHGTVCGAWWSGPICFDGTPNGYGIYEANGSSLSWKYKGTGLDTNHQFRFYGRGEHPHFKDYCSVNVWNWDSAWKVFWNEDGIRKGEMLRIVSRDPLSIRLHEGADLPARRKWVEPQLTDHMFYFNPDPSARQISVEVIDRFGNVYVEPVNAG